MQNPIDKLKSEVRKELGIQTNADRIRHMSDEELAEFLRKTIWNEGSDLFDCYGIGCDCACWKCDMYLKWLQSEAE